MLLMVCHHGGVVHFIDMIAGENDHIFRMVAINEVDVLINGIGGTLVPAAFLIVPFIGRQHLGAAVGLVQAPGLAVADVFIQFQRLILGQNANGINTGIVPAVLSLMTIPVL